MIPMQTTSIRDEMNQEIESRAFQVTKFILHHIHSFISFFRNILLQGLAQHFVFCGRPYTYMPMMKRQAAAGWTSSWNVEPTPIAIGLQHHIFHITVYPPGRSISHKRHH